MLIACVSMSKGLGIEQVVYNLRPCKRRGRIHQWIGDEQERWVENCEVTVDRVNSKSEPRHSFIKIDVTIQV